MKKLLFGLIATVLFSFSANAQKLTSTQNKVVSSQMVLLVEYAKSTGADRLSLPDWIKTTGDFDPTQSQKLLLAKVHSYASNGTSTCDIMNADNSILYQVAVEGGDLMRVSEEPKCNFWCWLKRIADILVSVVQIINPQ
ncbi:MAG: hypothetical protein V4648_02550 [Bacteroidota bacterium]